MLMQWYFLNLLTHPVTIKGAKVNFLLCLCNSLVVEGVSDFDLSYIQLYKQPGHHGFFLKYFVNPCDVHSQAGAVTEIHLMGNSTLLGS